MKFTRFGLKLFYLFLLVSLVPSGIAGAVVYKYTHDRTKEDVLGQLRYKAHSLNDKLGLLLSKRRFRVVDFGSDGFIRDCVEQLSNLPPDPSQISEKLNNHLIINKKNLDPDILEIEILDHKGEVIASTSEGQMGKDKSHEDYFRNPFLYQEQRGLFFSDALRSPETPHSNMELVFSSILTDKFFHKPLGVITTKVKGEVLQDMLEKSSNLSGSAEGFEEKRLCDIYIVNSDKLMIAGSSCNKETGLGKIIDTMQVEEVLATRGEFSGICENYRGVKSFCTALYVPETNWVILSEKEVQSALLPLKRIKYITLIAGGVAFFLTLTIAVVISSNISIDLRKLLSGIRRVTTGDLKQPILIGTRNDELREVGQSFNLMMDRLRESNESNVQLKSLDRLKDNIIKDVSHELKSPLAQLRLALEMWLKKMNKEKREGEERRKDNVKGDRFIEIIKGNISTLNNTVESILALADIESGALKYEKEILSLRVLINQVTDGQRLIAEKKNLLLTSTFSANLHEVLVDKTQIVRVVSNLIDNAIKYTESGEITVSAVRKNDDIEVAVKDTGIGIDLPKNNQDQVFERFFQEKASSQGIGVGLSICENIIKAHHGKIWVESKGKGNGSTFKFTLPVPLCGEFCSCCG